MLRAYFDHNATTPVASAVLDAYVPVLREVYGNASSIHQHGQAARQYLERARRQIATFLGAAAKEIVLLSGGTEANNLAIFGVLGASSRKHVVTTTVEHPAVLNACAQWEREGGQVTYVPVDGQALVDPADVQRALRPETTLVSVMHANNEIGTVQPIAEIAQICREAGVLFHCDGVQAVGKVPVNVAALGVDLYSVSAHKLYAPKGSGALFVRQGVTLQARQFGGRHEAGRRPGTENVAGAVAFGAACALAAETMPTAELRDLLERRVRELVPDVTINGAGARRLPNTTNLCFRGIEGEAIVIGLDLRGFAISSGSACSSGAVEPSHVLLAIGLDKSTARSCVRVSLGRENTRPQVEELALALAAVVAQLRKVSPSTVYA